MKKKTAFVLQMLLLHTHTQGRICTHPPHSLCAFSLPSVWGHIILLEFNLSVIMPCNCRAVLKLILLPSFHFHGSWVPSISIFLIIHREATRRSRNNLLVGHCCTRNHFWGPASGRTHALLAEETKFNPWKNLQLSRPE